MNMFSRRKNDPRENWAEDVQSDDEAVLMPPCDLWHSDSDVSEIGTQHEDTIEETRQSDKKSFSSPQCWAFMGAVGGVGTTTLAIQMAYELAQRSKSRGYKASHIPEPKVCLIDLDFESGSCIHHLDVEPSLSLDDLTSDTIRIDTAFAQALMSTHNSGISVLAAPNILGANANVKPQTVLALLDAACEMFPTVILDLPRQWQSWSGAAIAGSDFVGLLTDMTIPALHMARTKRAQLNEMFDTNVSCEFILNKYERRSFKNTLKLPDAQIALQSDVFGTVCSDPDITREAINRGEPVGDVRSDSRYTKDVRKLLEKISATTQEAEGNQSDKAGLAA